MASDASVRARIAAMQTRIPQSDVITTRRSVSCSNQKRYGTPPAPLATDAALQAGDQRIVVEPLDSADERHKIPRADGYDPSRPTEPRYGPHWKAEEDRRHMILQTHPYYRFLVLMAGYADTNVMRLINVDSMVQRTTAADVRRRITELQQTRSLQGLKDITEALDAALREQDALTTGLEDLQFQRGLITTEERLRRQLDDGITQYLVAFNAWPIAIVACKRSSTTGPSRCLCLRRR